MVGGKIESGEDRLSAAYRELEEETGIYKNDDGWPLDNHTYYDLRFYFWKANNHNQKGTR